MRRSERQQLIDDIKALAVANLPAVSNLLNDLHAWQRGLTAQSFDRAGGRSADGTSTTERQALAGPDQAEEAALVVESSLQAIHAGLLGLDYTRRTYSRWTPKTPTCAACKGTPAHPTRVEGRLPEPTPLCKPCRRIVVATGNMPTKAMLTARYAGGNMRIA